MTKQKTKSWEKEHKIWISLREIVYQPRYKKSGKRDMETKVLSDLLEFTKSLLHQERKRARKNEYNVAMMIETSLGYIEMGKKEKAIYHLEIAQEMLRPLSILKKRSKE